MSWVYVQASGDLLLNGALIATGYAGHGGGLNNPDDADCVNVGPLPAGRYTIGAPFSSLRCGPFCLRLTPDPGNTMDGRGGFLIHGDNFALDHSASEGCIVLPRDVREHIAASGDTTLIVVAKEEDAYMEAA